ncbi:MAG: sulfatase-like hydrolase/transferase, partial [Tunicatimonas sp.]|uniref:sulfatase family protein n=1 Tax=Tunicatimonas sp. TaxID=1940096 RepID=UPI003C7636C2
NTGIDYYTHERYGTPSMFLGNKPTTADSGTYSTYLFEREALAFLDENKERPFFLYLPFNAPHSASNLDPKIRGSVQAPEIYLDRYSGSTVRQRGYRAAITYMDASIGRILSRIQEYGLEENTIIVFLSDNGGGLGADNSPFRGKKGQFYEGGIRVPCIIKWPGMVESGSINNQFLSSLEIMPTLLAATNVPVPDSITLDGFNMVPVLQGETEQGRSEIYWELRGDQAARVGEWKWLKNREGEYLFNLEEDIKEENDLSTAQPGKLKMMREKFVNWQKEMEDAEPRGPFKNF